MTETEMDRRHWLLASSCALASLATRGTARAEALATPLAARLEPLSPQERAPVVSAMAIDPSGESLAVAGDDLSIRILDAGNLRELHRMVLHRDLIRTLAFRADSKILASAGNDGSMILWDRSAQWSVSRRVDNLPTTFCARFSPDGRQLAAVGFDSQLMLFGSSDHPQLRCECSDLRGVAYHSSGQRLAVVGRSGMLYLFDPRGGQQIGEFPIHSSRIRDIAFLPGTDLAATVGEDGAATIFDITTYRVVKRVDLLPCKLFTLAAIDATTIAVAGSDNRIRVVNCASGQISAHLDGHHGSISSLVFSGGYLYSGGFDASVRKWKLGSQSSERVAEKGPEGKR